MSGKYGVTLEEPARRRWLLRPGNLKKLEGTCSDTPLQKWGECSQWDVDAQPRFKCDCDWSDKCKAPCGTSYEKEEYCQDSCKQT